VGDHDPGALELVQGLGDLLLGHVVEGAGRLIQDQDLRFGGDRAGDQDPLFLTAGDSALALGDDRVHAHGHVPDVLGDPGDLSRLPGGVHVQPGSRDRDVGENVVLEELSVLAHDAHPASERPRIDPGEVPAVVEDRAALRDLEAQEQADQGRLAAACAAYDGDIFARPDLEGEILQHIGCIFFIAEGDMAHLQAAGQVGQDFLLLRHLRLCLQDWLHHLQQRRDRCGGNGNAGQGSEGPHDPPVGCAEGEIFRRIHAAAHGHIVEHDGADEGDRRRHHAVELEKEGGIVFERRLPGIQVGPPRERPPLRAGHPDLLDPGDHGIAHAVVLSRQFHLFPGDRDLQEGGQKADQGRDCDNNDRRHDQGRRKTEDLPDVEQGHHRAQSGRHHIAQQHTAQGIHRPGAR